MGRGHRLHAQGTGMCFLPSCLSFRFDSKRALLGESRSSFAQNRPSLAAYSIVRVRGRFLCL